VSQLLYIFRPLINTVITMWYLMIVITLIIKLIPLVVIIEVEIIVINAGTWS